MKIVLKTRKADEDLCTHVDVYESKSNAKLVSNAINKIGDTNKWSTEKKKIQLAKFLSMVPSKN